MGFSFLRYSLVFPASSLVLAVALAAACSKDPPANEVTRAMQSEPTAGAPVGPTGGFPSMPIGGGTGAGGIVGAGGTAGAQPSDGGAQPMPVADAATDPDAAADAGPELTECADEDAGIDLGEDAGAITCLAIGDLHVQYRASDTNATDQQIKPHFNLVNVGTETVALSELKVRYWYTRDSQAVQMFNCDYALIGCGMVQGAFSATARQGADQYFELSFGAGTLGPGAQTGEIQVRFNNEGWAPYDESNDYSFDPSHTAFADYYRATLYRRGSLVWGAEPPDMP